jgi:D-3-phosphoglycerate dehydrogenase
VLRGLLTPILGNDVNYVNAPVLAKERGIEVKEVKSSDAGDFTSVIRVRVESGKKVHHVAGTLFHKKDPRIIEIDRFQVEIFPEGHMLLIQNVDRPGVIGAVSSALGDHQINIARMQCSREERGGNALLIIGLDAPIAPAIVERIRTSPNILSVKVVDLSPGL